MLYNVDSSQYVTTIPHQVEFDIWKGRLSPTQLAQIRQSLDDLFNSDEIRTSSWIPGRDWSGTPWDSIYQVACLQDEEQAAKCFGLFVWEAALCHTDV